MTIYEVIKRSLITEKSTVLKETGDKYVFEVDARADKPMIKKSLEALFGVKVKNVKTCIVPGKCKKFGIHEGRTSKWKKAVVTLSSGKIELFEGV